MSFVHVNVQSAVSQLGQVAVGKSQQATGGRQEGRESGRTLPSMEIDDREGGRLSTVKVEVPVPVGDTGK